MIMYEQNMGKKKWHPMMIFQAISYPVHTFYALLRQISSVGQLLTQKYIMDYSFSFSKSAYDIELNYHKLEIYFSRKIRDLYLN